jgi:hypothetical protein
MLSAADGGQSIVGGPHLAIRMPDGLHLDPAWSPVMDLLHRWGQPDSSFHHAFDHIWLEFDVSGDVAIRAAPSVFFSPRDGGHLRSAVSSDERAACDRIVEAVSTLASGTVADDDSDRLRTAIDHIPEGAFLFQVGVMCARRPSPLRLLLSHLSPSDLVCFLEHIGWAGNGKALHEEVVELSSRLDGLAYSVEIQDGIGARVGIECYIHNDDWRASRDRWPSFVDYLVSRELCLPEKGEALLAYQGMSQECDTPGCWPSNLADAGAFLRGGVVPVLARSIHHVKLSFIGERVVEAKAYPGLSVGWVQRA